MKEISLNDTVYNLVKQYPEIRELIISLGFEPLRSDKMLNTAGRITRPLRHNGTPYQGINIILLWSEALARGFASNIWMTFKQAVGLGGHVRKGESGSTVVYVRVGRPY